MANVTGVSNLICFESIVAWDIGVIQYALRHYGRSGYIKHPRYGSGAELINHTLFRAEKNPLTLIVQEDYQDSCNDLLSEIMEEAEQEIYKLSPVTDIFRYLSTLSTNEEWKISNTVYCKNSIQEAITREIAPIFKTTRSPSLVGFDCLFIDDGERITKFSPLEYKHIYLSYFLHNVDDDFHPKGRILDIDKTNDLRLIDPYKETHLPGLREETVNGIQDEHSEEERLQGSAVEGSQDDGGRSVMRLRSLRINNGG